MILSTLALALAFGGAVHSWALGPGVVLPLFAGALLSAAAGTPWITARRALARATSRAVRSGLVPSSPHAMSALLDVGRWQVDPRLLSPSGSIEVVGDVEAILPVSVALLDDHPGIEAEVLRAELSRRGLKKRASAATRRSGGAWLGTVSGERWCLGTVRAVLSEAQVELPRELESSIDFLEERSAVTWILAQPGGGVMGAIAVQLQIEPDVARTARALSASVMPGAGDAVSGALAHSAEISRDGPPLGSRDATLVAPGSPAPSAGLVVEVREPRPGLALSAPLTMFAASLAQLPELIASSRKARRRARWAGWWGGLIPILVVVPLAALRVLDPVLATLAATVGLALALRATDGLTNAR